MSCRKCKKTQVHRSSGLCMQCSESTCWKCGGEKSTHAQMCPWCESNFQLEDEPTTEIIAPTKMNEIITKVFALARVISPDYIETILKHEKLYEKVFTAKTYDTEENYEFLEFLGDGIANSFLSFYFSRRFPLLDCTSGVKIIDQLKKNYASKRSFSQIAENLGFWPFIRASENQKQTFKSSLLEDVFEAFIGATVKILDKEYTIGVGYGIAYRILEAIFDNITISLEYQDLYDPKTRLKEIFDSSRELGTLYYDDKARSSSVYRITKEGQRIFMGEGKELPQKADRQQEAANQALKFFPIEEAERKRVHDRLLVSCGELVDKRNED